MKYLLTFDQGTTGTTGSLFETKHFRCIRSVSENFPQHFPQPGWVEHELSEIQAGIQKITLSLLDGISPRDLLGIGLTNQRETLCFWDSVTGLPLTRAIVWQDRRSTVECQTLKEQGLEPFFQEATGLLLDPYFSATKAAWALRNHPEVQKAAQAGRLALGTVDSFLLFWLTGQKVHATEPSNASRTLCYHLTEHRWSEALCRPFQIPISAWPQVLPSFGTFGHTQVSFLPEGIPITGILGDQQASLLGQGCIEPGSAKCTYGTGAFLLTPTGSEVKRSPHRLLTTIAWNQAQEFCYALEGSTFLAGSALQWLQEELELLENPEESESLATSVSSTEGVLFIPALTGLGAPYWKPNARGAFVGLTRGSRRAHFVRAVLESIAYQNTVVFRAMDPEGLLKQVSVDGGASQNRFLMQFQADLLGCLVVQAGQRESTSLGAAFAAALGLGILKHPREVQRFCQQAETFHPQGSSSQRQKLLQQWDQLMARAEFL